MGMLTGKEIVREIQSGNIVIDPFSESRVNPNSYNLRIGNHIKIYTPSQTNSMKDIIYKDRSVTMNYADWTYRSNFGMGNAYLDLHAKDETTDMYMKEDGLILYPNKLYLSTTIERTWTNKYIPILNGRSSVGRKGLTIHVTAGFGDIGFNGCWTLEMTVIHPLKIYPGDEICQVSFFTPEGETSYLYNGRYQGQNDTVASRFEQEKKGMYNE